MLTMEVVRGDQILSIFKSSFLTEKMRGVRERIQRRVKGYWAGNGLLLTKMGKAVGVW